MRFSKFTDEGIKSILNNLFANHRKTSCIVAEVQEVNISILKYFLIFPDSGIHYITYYLYYKVKLSKNLVKSGSAFVITPVPSKRHYLLSCLSCSVSDICVMHISIAK